MKIVFLSLFLVGCVTYKPKPCTYICPKATAPEGCYCLEDEINSYAR